MPFKSEAQRRYLHANEPEIAKEWEMEYPKRGQRTATNKKTKKTDPRSDYMKKTSGSNAGGASIGGGTAAT